MWKLDVEKLRGMIRSRHHTDGAFAMHIGWSQPYLSKVLKTTKNIRIATLGELCEGLRCTPNDVLVRDGQPVATPVPTCVSATKQTPPAHALICEDESILIARANRLEKLQQRSSVDLSALLTCEGCGLMLRFVKQNFDCITPETEARLLNAFARATAGRFAKTFEAGVDAVVRELHKNRKDNGYRRFSSVDLT